MKSFVRFYAWLAWLQISILHDQGCLLHQDLRYMVKHFIQFMKMYYMMFKTCNMEASRQLLIKLASGSSFDIIKLLQRCDLFRRDCYHVESYDCLIFE